jgi:phage protein D/phage baseplate assembly protein gpV
VHTLSDPRSQTSSVKIKVNGQLLGPEAAARVADVTIEQDMVLPDTFAIRIHDIANHGGASAQTLFPIADTRDFRIGNEVEIAMGREDQPDSALKGEITSLELEMRADGLPFLTVRGYDKAHRLNRQKRTRVFVNAKISDIVRTIGSGNGLSANVEDTQVVHPHMFQDNQTDWEFLRGMARTIGKQAYVRDNTLVFAAPETAGAALEQEFGISLRQLRLRMSASAQVHEVEVRGWDPKGKQAVVGKAAQPGQTAPKDNYRTGGQVAEVFGYGKYLLNDHAVNSQQEATQRAQAILDEISGDFIQFDCVCLGDAELRPGRQVKLKGISNRFSGEYYVSAASHHITPDRGYLTTVTVCGRNPNSLTALVGSHGIRPGGPAAARAPVQHPGVVVGIVTNNKDPDMGGRVKVKFPWFDETLESDWARFASPMAGNGRGFYWLPEIDDEVLVAFEHGDINHPYVVGCLWNGKDQVPKPADQVVGADGKVNQRLIKSRSGHLITIDDTENQENITIVDKTGKNLIKLESPSNKLTVSVAGDMIFEALQGNISVKGKTVAVEATDSLSIKGMSVSAEATQGLQMKGSNTEVEGRATMKVSGANTDVQANAKLGLSGGAVTEIKGAMIKLN